MLKVSARINIGQFCNFAKKDLQYRTNVRIMKYVRSKQKRVQKVSVVGAF